MDIVENKDLIETLSYLTVILSALIGAVIYLIKRYRNYEKYLDSVFTGHWVNEGRIDGINENTHSIDLYLESKNKSMIGTANLFKFDNSSSINIINVSGKRFIKRCYLEFKHYRQGKVTIYAYVKLVLRKNQLIWKLKKKEQLIFSPEKQFYGWYS
jgi:hypothetical protein